MGRSWSIEVLVRPVVVVVDAVISKRPAQPVAVRCAVEVDASLLDAAPTAFDEGIVRCAALTIRADLDAFLQHCTGERRTDELAALIGSEDPWRRALQEQGQVRAPCPYLGSIYSEGISHTNTDEGILAR